ncbi:30S ribosomal protein S6 modification protein [Actinoplanes sp. SE50]|uniref:ATP-grasp domain-containing protein n=1 Tax=unclassified Actinoplanes TaxID=2626549 RepID=UPI00023EE013|nr:MULTISPECIES: RimK family alpha-L-glutamate ligase [unclassified Actinoplanes]AEV88373.1 lysine biosynthesis protein LysX [Actinoplanes sp. SE50/110]ATO86778.1 30S ribosomal protein S6 modification protein [Actinoplanes sp. SE50]SLM04196.1 lysine biosynthesis protein LysX [Actinoplanes sp. SE50/110]
MSHEVLLTVTMLRPEEKLLARALRDRGIEVRTALFGDLAEVVSGPAAPPPLAIIRNVSHREAIDAARRLEHLGVTVLNRPSAIEICNDKGLQALVFDRNGIAHPKTLHVFGFDQVRAAVEEVGWPAVVKPVSGSWGRGVTRLTDEAGVAAWIGGRESVDAAGKAFPVLIQAYIDKPGHDLRVLVVGDQPLVAFRRVSQDWRTNTHLGATVERVEVTPEIAKLCRLVADALGDGFYGVDLVEDRSTGELLVLEVNASPDFARSSQVHGVDVAGHLADYAARRLEAGVPA